MLNNASRYGTFTLFTPEDASEESAAEGFLGIRARTIISASGILEHPLQEGERLDQLAEYYYGNAQLWWRIVDANPEFFHGDDLIGKDRAGLTVLIPQGEE
ncbi:MAG: hypothetical protein V3T17_12900 [Pseudomonadales bacterium]